MSAPGGAEQSASEQDLKSTINFWLWLLKGSGGKRGVGHLISWSLLIHIAVGLSLGHFVDKRLDVVADTVFLPLAGILVGLTFAWGGNAQAVLQTSQIRRMARHTEGGLADYAGYYQLAILLVLITLAAWGVGAMGLFEGLAPRPTPTLPYRCVAALLYFLTSLTVGECWGVVDSARMLLLARTTISEADEAAAARTRVTACPTTQLGTHSQSGVGDPD